MSYQQHNFTLMGLFYLHSYIFLSQARSIPHPLENWRFGDAEKFGWVLWSVLLFNRSDTVTQVQRESSVSDSRSFGNGGAVW